VFDEKGLNRRKLGEIVFGDADALRDLSAITLGYIEAELRRRIELARKQGRRGAAIDGATLLESELASECDALVAVVAPDAVRAARIMARDGVSEKAARDRIAAQRSQDSLREHCDYVLENDGSVEAFHKRSRELFETILKES
jgi:dephospho-CoA kinase